MAVEEYAADQALEAWRNRGERSRRPNFTRNTSTYSRRHKSLHSALFTVPFYYHFSVLLTVFRHRSVHRFNVVAVFVKAVGLQRLKL